MDMELRMEVRVEHTDLGGDSVDRDVMRKTRHTEYWKQWAVTRCREGHTGGGKNRQTDITKTKLQEEEDAGRERPGDPGEPSGWGGTVNVRDIIGGLSENQNPNSEDAILRVRRDPGAHPVHMLISS